MTWVHRCPGGSYNPVTVPLSDHEQRILDEIEKNLYQEDPRFARQVKERDPARQERKRAKLGALCFLAGFVGLMVFFFSPSLIIGVVAFAGMVLGIVLIAGAIRSLAAGSGLAQRPADRVGRALSGWEQRVRDRYKKS